MAAQSSGTASSFSKSYSSMSQTSDETPYRDLASLAIRVAYSSAVPVWEP